MKLKDILKSDPYSLISLLFSLIISIVLLKISVTGGILFMAVSVILFVLSFVRYSRQFERKKDMVRLLELSFEGKSRGSGLVREFPVPAVIIEKNGSIQWFNRSFEQSFSSSDTVKAALLSDIFPDFSIGILTGQDASFELDKDEKHYTVYPSAIDNDIYALYFTDDTLLKNIRADYYITRPAVLLINTDSLEQAEDALSHTEYYTLVADTERTVSGWLNEKNCVFRKISDGKFIAFTEKKNIDLMIKDNFDILNTVRNSRDGKDELDITLSVGIGMEDTFALCELSARHALDMARGRGGDQAALKTGENYEFFGGTNNLRVKRGKNTSRYMAGKLDDCMVSCSNVMISGHTYSDFDCIGAAVGIAAIAKANSKQAYIVVNRETTLASPLLEMLARSENCVEFISPAKAEELADDKTLLVITDTMRPGLVEAASLLEKGLETVIIDHHRKSVDKIQNESFFFHEPYASSACEMTAELIQYSPSKPRLSAVEAQALLAGIWLDTMNLSLRVGVRTFEAAAFLKDCKADVVEVRNLFSCSVEDKNNISKIVSSAALYENFAIASADFDCRDIRIICSKAADALLDITAVDASFVLWKSGTAVSVSARSMGKVNVQLIMEAFGGGGHQSMAGCRIDSVDIDEARKMLIGAIRSYFTKNTEKTEV